MPIRNGAAMLPEMNRERLQNDLRVITGPQKERAGEDGKSQRRERAERVKVDTTHPTARERHSEGEAQRAHAATDWGWGVPWRVLNVRNDEMT